MHPALRKGPLFYIFHFITKTLPTSFPAYGPDTRRAADYRRSVSTRTARRTHAPTSRIISTARYTAWYAEQGLCNCRASVRLSVCLAV